LAEIIELDQRSSRPPRCLVNFQITRQHRRFVEFADAVSRHRYIGVCYGAPGLGKTQSARTDAAADDYEKLVHPPVPPRIRHARVAGGQPNSDVHPGAHDHGPSA